ncbi:MAG: hypothetical protein JW781_04445, partial [Deltaproteobacteria bacterium]|nr:hypothetical protein [Candidatus Anaeroferrophillacea bacterium]
MNRRSIISTISRPALVLLFFTAAACSMKLGTPPPAAVSHVLRDPGAAAAAAGEGSEHALLIRETDAPALIGNRRMIFSRA